MQRFLSLGGVGVLILVLTAGLSFGHPTHTHTKPTPTHTSKANGRTANSGGSKMKFVKKKGKVKPGKKSGGKKKHKVKKHHHKKHHHKKHHHKKHHKKPGDSDDGDDGDEAGDAGGADPVDGADPSEPDDAVEIEPELQNGRGLLITDLDEQGPAALAGLDVDDTILSVNGRRVQTVEELRAAVEAATGPVEVVFISDDTGDVEEVVIKPRNGRIGVTMDVVELEQDT